MYTLKIDSSTFQLSKSDIDQLDIISKNDVIHLLTENKSVEAKLVDINLNKKSVELSISGKHYTIAIEDELDKLIDDLGFTTQANTVFKDIKAPMPGLVLEIMVKEGDHLEKDTQVLILEAMKMENVIKSPGEGVVKEISVKNGDAVEKGQLLITLD